MRYRLVFISEDEACRFAESVVAVGGVVYDYGVAEEGYYYIDYGKEAE